MSVQLDNDVWYLITGILQAQATHGTDNDKESAKAALLSLRLTNRFLAFVTASHLLGVIKIQKLDDESFNRLRVLLRSSSSCHVVRRYEFRPKIITSRQGELTSPYHKIPPHLDYGRNSNSPIIQAENRQLREAAAHWAQQYRIVYPTQNKAAAALKGAFKWSSTSGKSNLKDSVYFKALEAFANLTHLSIGYPQENHVRLTRVISTEYSIALGRYLANMPQSLDVLQLQSPTPNDLVTIERSMNDAAAKNSSQLKLSVRTLELTLNTILDAVDESLNVFPEAGSSLSALLQPMSQLQTLSIEYGMGEASGNMQKEPLLLLSPFSPPSLPELRSLSLHGLAFSKEDLLAFVTRSPARLTELQLSSISLTTPSWAQVYRTFATSDTLEYFLQPLNITRTLYHDLSNSKMKRKATEEDRQAHLDWQKIVEGRVSRSIDGENLDS